MGRGDKRSRKGKIFKGSFGNSRPQRTKKSAAPAAAGVKKEKTAKAEKPAAAKKAPAKKAAAKKKED